MHEAGLVKDLIRKVDEMVVSQGGKRAKTVKVKIGALSHLSGEHLRGHFEVAAQQTHAAGANLEWEMLEDLSDPYAQDIILESLEIEF
jgi:hydrogenase nickel incorporation protein HypA/HybF